MVARQAQMSMSRATIREFDDNHLMQEVKQADVYYSETPEDFERWQMVGLTSFPLKQEEDQKKKAQQKSSQQSSAPERNQTGKVDFNDDQPKGPAAEAVMLYLNGQRSHPVALVDDRRVRPYDMSEGEGAFYAPDGSEQMVLFKENGTYIMSLDNTSVKDKKNKKTRFVSLRHVTKKMQTHKIEDKKEESSGGGSAAGASVEVLAEGGGQQQQKEKYKHEGESVNTEVRCTANRIEFRAGDNVVGYYDVQKNEWRHKASTIIQEASNISHTGTQYFLKDVHVKGDLIVMEGYKPTNGAWLVRKPETGPQAAEFGLRDDEPLSESTLATIAQRKAEAEAFEARIAKLEERIVELEKAARRSPGLFN